jgi:pimeloyl-ACP methyl ester carboxylesterase
MPYFATEDNAALYYEERGNGRPVVLVHGWSCSRRHYKRQIPELLNHYRVISYDLRGHGDSQVTEHGLTLKRFALDLRELIEYLGLEEVSLVGWSMGAHVIWEHVRQFGCDNLYRLCSIDMTPKLLTDQEWKYGRFGNFGYKETLTVLGAMCEDWESFTERYVPMMFSKSGHDQELFDWCLKEARKNTPHVLVNMWIAMSTQDYRPVLPQISVPCLVTYGQESRLYSHRASEYVKEQIPDAELTPFSNCGHALHMESPEKFNRELIKFLGTE